MTRVLPRTRTAAVAVAAAACLAGPARAADVAILKSDDIAAWRPAIDALRTAAASHTVMEFDLRGSRDAAARLVPELKSRGAIIVAMGPLAAKAARELMPELALVYCMVQDPAGLGLQDAPNSVGVAFSVPARNQLVAFRAVNPKARRIGVIYSAAALGAQLEEARRSASALHLELVVKQAPSIQAVPPVVRELLSGPEAVDALWVPADAVLLGEETRRFLMATAVQAGKPVYASSASLVKEGALVSNSPEVASIGQSAADLVNRIARGEKPGRLAVLVPRTEVVINKRIADQLRVTIPEEALRAAQRVF